MSDTNLRTHGRLGTALLALACVLLAVPAFADSQARIVRLSSVDGDVQIDRIGQGYEKAFLNLPITQGAKLRANADGRAEVEFEDGSTLRITPGTVIAFPELSLRDSGAKLSVVNLQEGTAYVNFAGAKNDEFTLNFGHEAVKFANAAHIRVQMGDTKGTLAVFKGDVSVDGPSGAVAVDKKQSATFDLAEQDHYTLAKNLEQDPYDAWDKQQGEYHQRYMSSSSYGNSYGNSSPYGYGYGVSDLNYYGSYFNAPGYGMVWQPYFAGAGWDPFMNGSWVYYPGFGYTWVSGYPWGWAPYRYGSWAYIPTNGWVWRPGNSWTNHTSTGWNRIPQVVNAPKTFIPPQPPTAPGNTVVVKRGPFVTPSSDHNTFVIRNDSAGLGIPRGSVRNMGSLSREVKQQGFVTMRAKSPSTVSTAPPQMTQTSPTTPARTSSPPRMSTTPTSRPTTGHTTSPGHTPHK